MLIGAGVSCLCYFFVSCSGLISSVGVERAIFLLSFTCKHVFSGRRGFLFLLVVGIDYIISLSQSTA